MATPRLAPPPHSRLWKHNGQGAWIGRVLGLPSVSRSWRKYSESEALRLILEQLWRQHLEMEGLEPSDCRYEGIFL